MREHDNLIFPIAEYERRMHAAREIIAQRELDALIVTSPENIFYLSGYRTFGYYYLQALVIPAEREPFMVTRRLEADNVEARSWVETVRSYADTEEPVTTLRYALVEFGLGEGRLGYNKNDYFFRTGQQERLIVSSPDATFVDCSGAVEELRLIKSSEELAYIRDAAHTAEAAMRAGIDAVSAGVSENEVGAAMLQALTAAGSEFPAAPPYVASGPRGALGHASYERRKIEADECVLLEVGGNINCYHAALMRTVYTGDPIPEVVEAERLLQDALQVAMEMIRPGIAAGDVDHQSRYILDRYSYGGHQATRLGFSMGIAFAPHWGEGEAFSVQASNSAHFAEDMALYLVPWVQMPGRFGVGMSETVVVTAEGCEPLTHLERVVFLR